MQNDRPKWLVNGGFSDEQRAGLSQEGTRRTRGSILVVEDEPALLELLTSVLHDHGHKVLKAWDGLEGVGVFSQRKDEIGLVVCDIGLPGMDGISAFKQMRTINPDVPALFATGFADQQRRTEIAALGRTEFLQKPYRPIEVIHRIGKLLRPATG